MIRSAVTLLTLLALTSHLQQVSAGRRVQRLVILNRSELKIVPRFEFPVRLRSLRSAFNFQLPIQLRLTNRLNFDLRQRLRSVRSANATDAALDELLGQVRASGRAGFLHGLSTLRPLRWLQPAGNLKDCVRKAICEVSSVPLIHPDYGLFGEIINLLFRLNGLPSTDRLREFAQPADRPLKDCAVHFAGCPFSMFDYLQIS